VAQVGEVDWIQARASLEVAATRVAELLRTVRQPEAPALGEWNVAQLATHLSHAFDVVPGLARGTQASPLGKLWDLAGLTTGFVGEDPERDLGALAERIETRAAAFLKATAGSSADDSRPWLIKGTAVPLTVLTCHLLNESVIHGYDIAKADGRPWPIDRTAAALIFEGFILPVFQTVDPHDLVDQERAAGRHLRYDIRLRGAGSFSMVFDDGAVTIEGPSTEKVDCHLSVDPAAFLLVAWGRISQWQAIPKGQLLAWGRRPWLGLQLRGMLRNP